MERIIELIKRHLMVMDEDELLDFKFSESEAFNSEVIALLKDVQEKIKSLLVKRRRCCLLYEDECRRKVKIGDVLIEIIRDIKDETSFKNFDDVRTIFFIFSVLIFTEEVVDDDWANDVYEFIVNLRKNDVWFF